jgi:bacteriocin-like protein
MDRQFKFQELSTAELRAVEGGSVWSWIVDHVSAAGGFFWGMIKLTFRF